MRWIRSTSCFRMNEIQDLAIDPEADYVTLVTCTPYGINTHRLLVRGHRVDNDIADAANVTADAMQFQPYIVAPLVAAPIILILLIMLLIVTSRRNKLGKKVGKDAAHEAVENVISGNEADSSQDKGGDVHD